MSNVFDDIINKESDISEAESLENCSMYVPELGDFYEVYGDPYKLGEKLDDDQGENSYHAGGDCGLVSIANLLTTAGVEVGEEDIVRYAINNNYCTHSVFISRNDWGGTNTFDRVNLLESLGVRVSSYTPDSEFGNTDAVAKFIEEGKGVILGLNAGYIWDDPNHICDGGSNHCVFATGTVRDPDTGKLLGITVCDSGKVGEPSSSDFISVDVLNDAYVNAPRASCIVTDNPIR